MMRACRPLLVGADGGLQESVLEILRALLDPTSFTQKVGSDAHSHALLCLSCLVLPLHASNVGSCVVPASFQACLPCPAWQWSMLETVVPGTRAQTESNTFLDLFYDHYIAQLIAVLSDSCEARTAAAPAAPAPVQAPAPAPPAAPDAQPRASEAAEPAAAAPLADGALPDLASTTPAVASPPAAAAAGPTADGAPDQAGAAAQPNGAPPASGASPSAIALIADLLCFCVQQHSYRIKCAPARWLCPLLTCILGRFVTIMVETLPA